MTDRLNQGRVMVADPNPKMEQAPHAASDVFEEEGKSK